MRGESPRVLICDDAEGYRLLVQTVLEEEGFEVAGAAADWDEAARRAEELRPDVVLLDLWLPQFDRSAIERVCEHADGSLVAVLTAHEESHARGMLEGVAGVDLVLSKRDPPDALARALRERL